MTAIVLLNVTLLNETEHFIGIYYATALDMPSFRMAISMARLFFDAGTLVAVVENNLIQWLQLAH